jgi:hypothetical protein
MATSSGRLEAASTTRRASATESAIGFSTSTCLPASSRDGHVGVILRRQGQHHAVDFRIGENLLDGHGPDRMDAGKLACPVCMAVADGMKRAELGEGAGMVGAPVTTSDDGDPGGGGTLHGRAFPVFFLGVPG